MLLVSWLLGVAKPSLIVLLNVVVIVLGVMIASYDEVQFVWLGFMYQAGGILAESLRLVMIQILLSGDGQKSMDPLVSLYYYAPVCAAMNFLVAFVTEYNSFEMAAVWNVGVFVLVLNATVAFMLNVASVMLVCIRFGPLLLIFFPKSKFGSSPRLQIGKTSGLVMTLCGVLKNILLVYASMAVWGTIVGGLQAFGFSIALAGLVYYSIGHDGVVTYYSKLRNFDADEATDLDGEDLKELKNQA